MRAITQEEIYQMRFEDIYRRSQRKELSYAEASELLGISERTFLRKRQRYESEGFDGRFDLRLGAPSPRKATDEEIQEVVKLYKNQYEGFSVKHFHEFVRREHKVKRSYGWTKNVLIKSGVIRKSTRGGKHRQRRERRPMEGMMIHQDGSTHRWIEFLDRNIDLIVTMDDATSKITSMFFVEEEGTMSSFRGIRETIEEEGLFCSFYTDRGSHYTYTPEAGGKVDKHRLTQVGRALKHLGIRHIAAYSPQARGRSERMFQTLQGRLPQELKLKGIKTIEEANSYLKDVYLPRHNAQFSVQPRNTQRAFTPWVGPGLKDILCVQEERTVQNDNTIRYKNFILQIPKNDLRHHYVKTTVMVHVYEDHSMAAFYGHLCLGRYDQKGNLLTKEHTERDLESAFSSAPHTGRSGAL